MKPSRGRGRQKTEDNGERTHSSPRSKNQSTRLSKPGDKREKRFSDKRSVREETPGKSGGRSVRSDFKTHSRSKPESHERGKEKNTYKGGRPFRPRPVERLESRKSSGDRRIRLNRFLSNAGIASRREADQLIELGLVQVNGKVVREMGILVDPQSDTVKYDDRVLRPEKFRYVLLNKPKDFLTTAEDPQERRTVMELVAKACQERIYPVGRLDRQTTGLLLFTNDGDLARKLTHPKLRFPKLYHVETTSKVKPDHLDEWRKGVQLEDGFMKVDEVSFVEGDLTQIGIKIHSGKNRVVRRLFEHFGYTVRKLDRVMLGSLTKKDLPRGRYRHLTDQEVAFLRMMK
jgi:23S rRNA pseudouridine2605 synthase